MMRAPVDPAAPVRDGEELDLGALENYLSANLEQFDGGLEVAQFPSGHSNLTYSLRIDGQEYVLRRPPFGSKVKSAHDMGREFRVLSHLHPVYAPAPKPLLFCGDPAVMGCDFYIMERIEGTIFRAAKPDDFETEPKTVRGCCEAFIDNLVRIHEIDWEAAGLGALRKTDGEYCERQVKGWTKRYYGSQTDDIADIEKTIQWLNERIPHDAGAVVVHNDYKFDNIVFDPGDITKIIGVLDWEMTTIGDPLMDLGTSLGYWVQANDDIPLATVACFLTQEPGAMTRLELAERYAEKTGRDISNLHYYQIFALFKLAVIVQQIYYRYHQGLTKDPRFAIMIEMVKILGTKAVATIETGKV